MDSVASEGLESGSGLDVDVERVSVAVCAWGSKKEDGSESV